MGIFSNALRMKRLVSAPTPPSGTDALYFKSDGNLYIKDSAGVERLVSAAQAALTGEIKMWSKTTPPTGYLICDGSQQPVASYPALDALLGTTFGARTNGSGGAGTTHFRLPDFCGRSPIGAGTVVGGGSAGNSYNVGTKWGHEAMQDHNHGVQVGYAEIGTPNWNLGGGTSNRATNLTASTTTANAGGGNAGNVHPVLGINFIIKT